MRVAVVGAGVIGITTAVAVKEAFPSLDVTVFADAFSPDTTGDGSAGLWSPYILADTDPKKILRWSLRTFKWMESFWKTTSAKDVGVSLLPVFRVTTEPTGYPEPSWAPIVYGAHKLTDDELEKLSKQNGKKYTGGYHFLSFTCEPTKFLPYLMNQFRQMNGKIRNRKIENLEELKKEGYNIVINCSGIRSSQLASDQSIIPVRGQVARVKAPWIFEVFLEDDDDGNYVIPNISSTILGGTHQENDYDTSVRQEDSIFIRKGCERIHPSITKCQLIKEWVGLRPGRQQVRLEVIDSPKEKNFLIIHNYGHGGSGITVCWGCALDVVDILRHQRKLNMSKL